MMKLSELIEQLEEIRNDLEGQGHDAADVEVLGIHQPGWPLQETISHIWSPLTSEEHVTTNEPFECFNCGDQVSSADGGPIAVYWNEEEDTYNVCGKCAQGDSNHKDAGPMIAMVLDGHPHNRSPYGSRRAWDQA